MGRPSKQVMQFMETNGIESDEIWEVRPGAWAVKHSAIERVVAERGIKFERPAIIEVNTAEKIMVICVFGTMGDRTEWSFGEASPANCKIAYPASIAEKRAKDRVAIKLLNATGAAIFSEDESDDFKQSRQNPHVTRPSDIVPAAEYDENGEVIDNIPAPSPDAVKKLRVVDQRPIFAAMQKEIQATGSITELQQWAATNKDRLGSLKPDWQDFLRGVFAEHRDAIRQLEQGDDNRMAG
jgi:hypothetical protein